MVLCLEWDMFIQTFHEENVCLKIVSRKDQNSFMEGMLNFLNI